ncbi:MFS transporter [Bermanella marisrubri]|uniref:Permease of the major facilitator superfamily protein n=1 Tax=Bermanella marisrubri TaxID=207949 RepID=Q1N496_9GAMM|nr:MFS transporter [Bermanella marisrubri]EAT12969.1 Permease of the major facilitator superfamily protein [Oceanobacter sp. RED65] [Bermanella marisrubri]QIZ82903.1 MFS transporter [Bermanella marisrubri]
MSQQGQFSLLKHRRFLPYFVTQALGAFNDNLFKNALLLFITFGGLAAQEDAALYTNLAAGLFILPFFLFSPIAGQIADSREKSQLIRWIKLLEVFIMGVAAIALFLDSVILLLSLLFLMGTQSAFFGPVKFALLPQQLKEEELVGGNALVEMGTFLAILAGTITAGLMFDLEAAKYWIAAGVIFFAVTGYLSSRAIPEAPANDANLVMNWNPFSELKNTLRQAKQKRSVFLSILAISWFWFLGASYLTQFPNFARDYLGGNTQIVTLLLTLFSLGVAAGSLICERLSGHKIELGIVPIGSIGMSIFGIDMYFASQHIHVLTDMTAMMFIQEEANWRLMFDIAMVSAFGGIFVVPLQALIQNRSDEKSRAQVIAANNVMNSLFMVASAAISILLLTVLNVSLPEYFLILGVINIFVAAYVYMQVPEFVLRFFIWILTHTMYRVKDHDLDKIPDDGPAVLVCNHVSYVDALIIAGCHHRPIRFVMDRSISEMKGLKTFFKWAKTIPICSPKADADVYETAFKRIKEELAEGELVCIFPEGKLTKSGEINEFKAGIERIIAETPVPVIPMGLEGLWGSVFSHKDGYALTKRPKRFWSKVQLKAGDAVAPENVSAVDLQDKVQALVSELEETNPAVNKPA